MRHKFLVLPVKKVSKSVHIYGSYRKIKTGVPFFWNTRYVATCVYYYYYFMSCFGVWVWKYV